MTMDPLISQGQLSQMKIYVIARNSATRQPHKSVVILCLRVRVLLEIAAVVSLPRNDLMFFSIHQIPTSLHAFLLRTHQHQHQRNQCRKPLGEQDAGLGGDATKYPCHHHTA